MNWHNIVLDWKGIQNPAYVLGVPCHLWALNHVGKIVADKGDYIFQKFKLILIASYVSKLFVGVEARGFMFGPSIALAIGAKFVPLRKPRKLPGKAEL